MRDPCPREERQKPSLRITDEELRVLPPMNQGVGSQLTLAKLTDVDTVIGVPPSAVAGSGETVAVDRAHADARR